MGPQLLNRPRRSLRVAAGVEAKVEAARPSALHVADHGGAEQHGVERVHVGLHVLGQESLQSVQNDSAGQWYHCLYPIVMEPESRPKDGLIAFVLIGYGADGNDR